MPTKRQRRKRRRRLASDEARPPVPAPAPAAPPRKRSADDRPPPLWGTFPLTEIVIFIGVVLLIAGFFMTPPQGFVLIAVGLGLASLAGLELSLREHFTAYRSHTLLLAAAIGVPVFGVMYVATTVPPVACLAVGLVAFAGAAWFFALQFRRRSGGALYRLR
jgi:hypothetical protein